MTPKIPPPEASAEDPGSPVIGGFVSGWHFRNDLRLDSPDAAKAILFLKKYRSAARALVRLQKINRIQKIFRIHVSHICVVQNSRVRLVVLLNNNFIAKTQVATARLLRRHLSGFSALGSPDTARPLHHQFLLQHFEETISEYCIGPSN